MYQIKIIKTNGEAYGCAVPTIHAVTKLAELRSIVQIILYGITPREYNYLRSLDLPKKIKITR